MMTEFLRRPEGVIAYDDTLSPGPLVVCVPSLGDVRGEYRFLRPLLVQAGYRVVTMDVRGHGESSTGWPDYAAASVGADVVALIQHLNAGPAAVIGTSMAAAAAVWAAAEAPELVGRIVLVGAFVRDMPMPFFQKIGLGAMLAGPWRVAAWTAYYGSLYPTAKPADFAAYRAALKKNLAEPGRFAAVKGMLAAPKAPCTARLGQVQAPALVMMGSKDPDFPNPAAEAAWLAEQVRGRVVMVEGAGHYPHAEMPAVAGAAIVAFLQEGAASIGA
ncbi:MAG: alpha/beta hydrolase fold protein [Symbiobacteriaceae bacterium]|jgi:pimeloyl-ACP methyl ester carboxylesterase|nr:alpha/beta hydrolase fold protein [Symbiobacteriaceae bacterium]